MDVRENITYISPITLDKGQTEFKSLKAMNEAVENELGKMIDRCTDIPIPLKQRLEIFNGLFGSQNERQRLIALLSIEHSTHNSDGVHETTTNLLDII